ncbi:hypothetical protein ABK040_007783 [Willaertia magna]
MTEKFHSNSVTIDIPLESKESNRKNDEDNKSGISKASKTSKTSKTSKISTQRNVISLPTCCGVLELSFIKVAALIGMIATTISFLALAAIMIASYITQQHSEMEIVVKRGEMTTLRKTMTYSALVAIYAEDPIPYILLHNNTGTSYTQLLNSLMEDYPEGFSNRWLDRYNEENNSPIALENRALAMLESGDRAGAFNIINGTRYRSLLSQFDQEMDSVLDTALAHERATEDDMFALTLVGLVVISLSLIIMFPIIIGVFGVAINRDDINARRLNTANAIMLMDTMSDDKLRELFKEHCKVEHSEENFGFLEKVTMYKRLCEESFYIQERLYGSEQSESSSTSGEESTNAHKKKYKEVTEQDLRNVEKKKYELAFEIYSDYLELNGQYSVNISKYFIENVKIQLDNFNKGDNEILAESIFDIEMSAKLDILGGSIVPLHTDTTLFGSDTYANQGMNLSGSIQTSISPNSSNVSNNEKPLVSSENSKVTSSTSNNNDTKDVKKKVMAKNKKARHKNKTSKRIARCLSKCASMSSTQSFWYILTFVIVCLVLALTLSLAFYAGLTIKTKEDKTEMDTLLDPFSLYFQRTSGWASYFAESPSVVETLCNYTKSNLYKQMNLTNNIEEHEFKWITNLFYEYSKSFNVTIYQVRFVTHEGIELIRVDNKETGNGTFGTFVNSTLQNISTRSYYKEYYTGNSVNSTWFSTFSLSTDSAITDMKPIVRVQKTMLCSVTDDEINLFSNYKNIIVRRSDGSLAMRAGFVLISMLMKYNLDIAKESAASQNIFIMNDKGQYIFHNLNSSKEWAQVFNLTTTSSSLFTLEDYSPEALEHIKTNAALGTYLPYTNGRHTLFYASRSTNAETYYAVQVRIINDLFYSGFFVIVAGLFFIFMFVTLLILVLLAQRNNLEEQQSTKTHLITVLENQFKKSTEQKTSYEKGFYSLIPLDMLDKLLTAKNLYNSHQIYDFKKHCVIVNFQIHFHPESLSEKHSPINQLSCQRFCQYTSEVYHVLRNILRLHGFSRVGIHADRFVCIKYLASYEEVDEEYGESSTDLTSTGKENKSASKRTTKASSTISGGSSSTTAFDGYEHLLSAVQLALSTHYLFNEGKHYIQLPFGHQDAELDEIQDGLIDPTAVITYSKLPFPKVTTFIHTGEGFLGTLEESIPCLHVFGDLTDRIEEMNSQFSRAKLVYLSETTHTKLMIAASLERDAMKLGKHNSGTTPRGTNNENIKAKLLELLGIGMDSNSSDIASNSEKVTLVNHKDFLLYKMEPHILKDVDEIRRNDPEFFFANFIPYSLYQQEKVITFE